MDDLAARVTSTLDGVAEAFGPVEPVAALLAAARAQPTGESLNALGTALVRAGHKDAAARVYEIATEVDPALHKPVGNLANLALERGDLERAIALFERATSLATDRGPLWAGLGSALQRAGELRRAVPAYEKALQIAPSAAIWHNLGICLAGSAQLRAAIPAFREALRLDPDAFLPCFALIEILNATGSFDEVRPLLEQAARIVPPDPDVIANLVRHFHAARLDAEAERVLEPALERWPTHETLLFLLGMVLGRSDRVTDGERFFQRAIELGATEPGVFLQLAKIRLRQKRFEEERAILEDAWRRFPDAFEVGVQLAASLKHAKRIDEAEALLRHVLERTPSVDAMCMLAATRLAIGDSETAMQLIHEADKDPPDEAFVGSLAALVSNYSDEAGQPGYRATVERWVAGHLGPVHVLPPRERSLDRDRRLRVGYVSPDFRAHSVSRFMEPLLVEHDRRAVDIVCYSITDLPHDAVTERIRALDLELCDLARTDAFELAKRARDDGIDILVDLAGWTAEQRLRAFTLCPAPIQITYLGYPATLGVKAIGFRITDTIADPPGADDAYTERLVRLDRCAWAFRLMEEDSAPIPLRPDRPITFGSFNNLSKVGTRTLDLFAAVLHEVPGSRLYLKAKQLEEARAVRRIEAELEKRGVDRARVDLVAWTPTRIDHMQLYHQVDVALDTYPYNGTTTTCEALWMGVPVVTLRGAAPASRVGHSLLSACGLGHLCADSLEGYVRAARELASSPETLAQIKQGLRARVQSSELGDCAGLARALERAYRGLWNAWVDEQEK